MHTGKLSYDSSDGRYCILYKDEYGSNSYCFHCGDCLDVLLNKIWIPTRIEMGSDDQGWYLVGIPGMPPLGTPIRA